ncbi:hypothetical protein GN316_19395 [Xylophilus sp. Kf1]|nr:hypothetical protein [Xylophilus sp. Kf1]
MRNAIDKTLHKSSLSHGIQAALAAGALVAAFNVQATSGDLATPDVVGISPGQTADQVEATLRARDPKMRIVKVYWRGLDGKPTNSVAKIAAGIELPGTRIEPSSEAPRTAPDWVMVFFTQTDSVVYAIYRQVNATPGGVLGSEVGEAFDKKYGSRQPNTPNYIYQRALDKAGKLDGSCLAFGFRFTFRTPAPKESCGQSIRIDLAEQTAPGVYGYTTTWLFDHRIAVADFKASQALSSVKRDQENQRAVDAARGRKPSL